MKNILKIYSTFLLLCFVISCGTDNYDAPESTLTGKITYNNNPVRVRGTGEAVQLQLFQDGWQKHDPISVYVNQDGSFTAKLFDGIYKMVTRDNNGPWVNSRDTTVVTVKGFTTTDLSVTPYFTIANENISLSGSNLNVSLTINQVVATAQLEQLYIVLSKTQFADEVNNVFRMDISDATVGSISKTVNISDKKEVMDAKALFGRVGVKTRGTEQAIWSSVVRLK